MNNQDYYNKEYVPQVNKIGKITGYLGVLLSFTPALVLAVVYGILPKPAALLTAFISGASAFGVLWFVEPISYFPVVGADCALNALAIDEPLEYARLYLDGTMQMWVDAEDSFYL